MSRPALYTPEEARERRREGVRTSVARHQARLASMTRLEQAAWKARASLGEDYTPYTAQERAAVDALKARIAEMEAEAERLNGQIRGRLTAEVGTNPDLAPLLGEMAAGKSLRIDLKPF